MSREHGVTIEKIYPGTLAERSGLLPGDILVSIDSHKLRDPIDFLFYNHNDSITLEVNRNGKCFDLHIVKEEGKALGIDFVPFRVITCNNNCIFCFVRQLPKGLRKTLYVKDDDYRMSFLYGNYVTLTNLREEDRKRIIEQRLSPLYISVHSTNRTLRNRILGNAKAPDIFQELKFFTDHKIRFHAQIVHCPGYNDGKELIKTIRDLYKFYPYILSVAVVPVGLTKYQKHPIRSANEEESKDVLKIIDSFQKRFIKKHGDPIVYAADELYIKAKIPFPPLKNYRDLPQIENGVGMVSLFINRAKKLKIPLSLPRNKRVLTFTGISFYPFLKRFVEKLQEKENLIIEVIPIENTFLGSSITVAGLLTGKDIIKTLFDKVTNQERILVPDIVLKNQRDMFLDDITLRDVEEALSIPVKKIEPTPEGLINGTG